MKRIPELRDLSEDHHHGLVLARKARKAAAGKDRLSSREVWAEVELSFKIELEPHFQIEESLIAPPLEKHGELQLSKRLLDEHKLLRNFFSPKMVRSAENLGRFGELLDRHIRYEEREVFETAQNLLNPEELAEVAKACQAMRGGK